MYGRKQIRVYEPTHRPLSKKLFFDARDIKTEKNGKIFNSTNPTTPTITSYWKLLEEKRK